MPNATHPHIYARRDQAREWAAQAESETALLEALEAAQEGRDHLGGPLDEEAIYWERSGLAEGAAHPTEAFIERAVADPWLAQPLIDNPQMGREDQDLVVARTMEGLEAVTDPEAGRFDGLSRWQKINGVVNRYASAIDGYVKRHGRLPGPATLTAVGWIEEDLRYEVDEPSLANIRARAAHQTLACVRKGLPTRTLLRMHDVLARRCPEAARRIVRYRSAGPALYRELLARPTLAFGVLEEILGQEAMWNDPGCRKRLKARAEQRGEARVLLGLLTHDGPDGWRGWFNELSAASPGLASWTLERRPAVAAATLDREDLVPLLAAESSISRKRALGWLARVQQGG